jgi:hypothetical protein
LHTADRPAKKESVPAADAGDDATKQVDQTAQEVGVTQEGDAAAEQDKQAVEQEGDQAVKQEGGDQPGTDQRQDGSASGAKAGSSAKPAEAEAQAGSSKEASGKQVEAQKGDENSLPDNVIEEGKVTFFYK